MYYQVLMNSSNVNKNKHDYVNNLSQDVVSDINIDNSCWDKHKEDVIYNWQSELEYLLVVCYF